MPVSKSVHVRDERLVNGALGLRERATDDVVMQLVVLGQGWIAVV
jgi:hypothetical protein